VSQFEMSGSSQSGFVQIHPAAKPRANTVPIHAKDNTILDMIPPHQRQTCKACGHRDKFNFNVPDEVWAAVVPPELVNRVICLACFDEFARQRDVSYATHLRTLCFVGDRGSVLFRVERASNVA
jgi:hypothetical protein